LQKVIQPLFLGQSPPGEFEAVCAALPLDFVIAKDTDAAWGNLDSWVWRRKPVFGNRFVRIFPCAVSVNKLLR